MKFKRTLKADGGLKPLAIFPLLNMVLILIVFLVLVNPLTAISGMKIHLPKTLTSDVIKDGHYTITISSEDLLYVGGGVVTQKELSDALRSLAPKKPALFIRANRRASVGRVVEVWNLCRELGIEKINLATNEDK